MANEGRKGTNGSQFFMTLSGECKELEGRNTMFGRVVGDTIFNLVKMGEAELGEGERPMYPTKITGAEVLVNPFEEMVKREIKRMEAPKEEKKEGRKGKKKGGKVLLSFGGDEGDDGEELVGKKEKFNTKLVATASSGTVEKVAAPKATPKDIGPNGRNGHSKAAERQPEKRTEKTFRRRSSISRSPPPKGRSSETQLPLPDVEVASRSPSTSPEPAQVSKMSNLLDKTNAQIADLKASMKRNIQTGPVTDIKPKSAIEQMIPPTAVRGRKRKRGAGEETKESRQTLKLLSAFRSKLEEAPSQPQTSVSRDREKDAEPSMNGKVNEQIGEDEEEAALCDLHFVPNCQSCKSWDRHMSGDADAKDGEDKGWMSHALSFEKDRLGKDLTWKKKNEEELVVIDPREKVKDIKDEVRAKKMAKTGGSTAWAKDRDLGRAPDKRAGQKG